MFEYNAKVKRVIDGDTVDAYIDLGFDVWVTKRIRLMGINAPESRTRDLIEKRYGLGAKLRLIEMLQQSEDKFVLKSHGTGKYGRVLGELFIVCKKNDNSIVSINKQLVKEGHAVEYFGGSRQEVKSALIKARSVSEEYVLTYIEEIK